MHRFARSMSAWLLLGVLAPLHSALAAESTEVERTLCIVELRNGLEANGLTADYLKEVVTSFQEDNNGDYILVAGDKAAEKLRKDRDQVPGALTDDRRAQLTDARKKGVAFLDNADTANAIKALQAVEAKYRAALAAPGADDKLRKEYLEVLAQLATAYVVAKDKDAASEVFRTVITTFGLKANVTDNDYRPDVVALFKSIVKEVNGMQKGSVEVTSVPAAARIILGGNDRGAAPMTVADLIPGTYSLRLQQGTSTSLLHRIKVTGGVISKIAIDLGFESHLVIDEKSLALGYADLDKAGQRVQADAIELGKQLEVNMVAVVGVVDGKLVSYLIDVGKGQIVRTNNVAVPNVGISKRAVGKTMVTILGARAEKNQAVGGSPAGSSSAWYTSIPGWACAGVGVVGLGLGFAKMSTTLGDGTSVSNFGSPTVHTQAEQDSVKSNRTLSGVGFGLGVVGLAAAGVLFAMQGKSAPASAAMMMPQPGQLADILPPLSFGQGPVTFATH